MNDPIKVLLVDDEERNLVALESILDDPSYLLIRADNADVALKLLLEHDVAAIVLDIKMPGVSGFELAQLIKGTKKFRQIPIIFLTAYLLDDKDVLAGYGAGGVDYLTKPVNPQILRHKVAVFADLFRKTQALAELNGKLETRVRERTAELERANRMKDEFLATLSHELRTPLNAVLGWASILRNDARSPSMLERGLDAIYRNSKTQERMVTELLDVARIISGKLRLNMKQFPLSQAIQAAVDVVRPAANAKGVLLVVDVAPDVGMMVGDPDRLQQVVWNLLTNAIRYTPGGRITLTVERIGSANVVRIEDAGVGIAAEHLPYIFDRFRQVDNSTTRANGGLGLGLALVRHLVEAHGGVVEAHSGGMGCGATFTVSLPGLAVGVSAVPQPRVEAEAEPKPAHGYYPRRRELADMRVLAVEDDPDSRELLRIVLEEAGAVVTGVASAGLAMEALAARSYDIMISDVAMPDIDGHELMRWVRSRLGQQIPAIALSAHARSEDIERSKQAGYQEHLVKPVDPHQLVNTVKRVVPMKTAEGVFRNLSSDAGDVPRIGIRDA